MSGALVFISGILVFVAAAQGMSLDHLALVAGGWGGLAFLGSTGLWQYERWFFAGYHPRALHK